MNSHQTNNKSLWAIAEVSRKFCCNQTVYSYKFSYKFQGQVCVYGEPSQSAIIERIIVTYQGFAGQWSGQVRSAEDNEKDYDDDKSNLP